MKTSRPHLWIGGIFLGALLLVVFLPLAASPTRIGGILSCLPLGWWRFLERNLPQVTVNWHLIVTGLLCSALAVVVGNQFLRALIRQAPGRSPATERPRWWPWRWTICGYCGLWLLFVIAFGAVGVLRHTTWLMEYRQPWYEKRISAFVEFSMIDGLVQELLLENNGDLESTRKAFGGRRLFWSHRSPAAEQFNVIFYGDKSNKVTAYLIIPRQPQLLAKGQFGAVVPGSKDLVKPLADLPRTVAELDAAYPARGL